MVNAQKVKNRSPHPLVLLFIGMLFSALLTYVVPLGRYELQDAAFAAEQNSYAAVDANSFRYVTDDTGKRVTNPVSVFGDAAIGEHGIMSFLFTGLSAGKPASDTAFLIAYLLVIGGSFGVLKRTGVVDQTVLALTRRLDDIAAVIPPILFVFSSWLGAAIGFREAAIPLAMFAIPLLIHMQFDAITGILSTFAAVQIGTALSWFSPTALVYAQMIADIPSLSGAQFRMILWAVFTLLGAAYTTVYAVRVRAEPHRSISQAGDAHCRGRLETARQRREMLSGGSLAVLLVIAAVLGTAIYGSLTKQYGAAQLASLFFVMAILSGLLGVGFRLNGMRLSDMARAFQAGAGELVGAVLIVGMARGLVFTLGGTSPTSASVFNTLLHWVSIVLSKLPELPGALILYLVQLCTAAAVPFDLAHAALSIPVTAPLADVLGFGRQIIVLIFQLASSLAHLIIPTSGCLIAVLSIARVEWADWLRSQWRAMLTVFLLAGLSLVLAVGIGYA